MSHLRILLAACVLSATALSHSFAQGPTTPAPKTDKKPSPPAKEAAASASKTAVGIVKAAAGDNVLVVGKVKGQDTEWTFAVDAKTKVRKASQDVTAAELRPGDPVSVRYLEQDGRTIAQHIAVTTPVKPKTPPAPAEKR